MLFLFLKSCKILESTQKYVKDFFYLVFASMGIKEYKLICILLPCSFFFLGWCRVVCVNALLVKETLVYVILYSSYCREVKLFSCFNFHRQFNTIINNFPGPSMWCTKSDKQDSDLLSFPPFFSFPSLPLGTHKFASFCSNIIADKNLGIMHYPTAYFGFLLGMKTLEVWLIRFNLEFLSKEKDKKVG